MDKRPETTDLKRPLATLRAHFDTFGEGLGAVQRVWAAAVGEQAARHTMPVALDDGELRVRCSSSTWASELLALSTDVLRELERRLGTSAPRRLKPYAGRLPSLSTETAPERPPATVTVDPATVTALEARLGGIAEPETRRSVARAMAAARARRTTEHRP